MWRTLEGFSRYKVNKVGKVWDSKLEQEVPQVWNGNYLCVNMVNDSGKKSLEKVHRVVARGFLDEPVRAHFVRHLDEDRSNNHYTNLEWVESKFHGVGLNSPRVSEGVPAKLINTWKGMLSRCYGKNTPYYMAYGGRGVTVTGEWLDFKVFREWYEREWFQYEESLREDVELDKDIVVEGNLLYSPETCLLVPRELNQLFKRGVGVKKGKDRFDQLILYKNLIPYKIYSVIEGRLLQES